MNLLVQIVFLILAHALIANSYNVSPHARLQGQQGFMNYAFRSELEEHEKPIFKHIIKRETNIGEPINNNKPAVETKINPPEEPPTTQKTIKKELAKQMKDKLITSNDTTSNINVSVPKPLLENKTVPLAINKTITIAENVTKIETPENKDQKSGAQKRGLIVFGTLGLVSFFYIVYKYNKRQNQMRDNNITFDSNDNQFKYGILTSNEHGDNLEMSNIPLTAESDEEDELEIFDLEGRRRFEMNSTRNDGNIHDRLLAKDVEILDLDLPGVKSASHPSGGTAVDDDLLNLDDAIDEILSKPVIQNNFKGNSNSTNNDNFFDVL